MHPFINQSIAAERTADLRQAARHGRDAKVARDRRLRQHQAPQAAGAVHLLPARLRLHTS